MCDNNNDRTLSPCHSFPSKPLPPLPTSPHPTPSGSLRNERITFATIFPNFATSFKVTRADLIGNVYARFKYEDSAQSACDALNSRWYAARPIYCELSPVTDFREACCRLNSGEGCVRGGFCNFIHRKEPSPELERELELGTKKWLRMRGRDQRSMSRTPSPEPTRKRY